MEMSLKFLLAWPLEWPFSPKPLEFKRRLKGDALGALRDGMSHLK